LAAPACLSQVVEVAGFHPPSSPSCMRHASRLTDDRGRPMRAPELPPQSRIRPSGPADRIPVDRMRPFATQASQQPSGPTVSACAGRRPGERNRARLLLPDAESIAAISRRTVPEPSVLLTLD